MFIPPETAAEPVVLEPIGVKPAEEEASIKFKIGVSNFVWITQRSPPVKSTFWNLKRSFALTLPRRLTEAEICMEFVSALFSTWKLADPAVDPGLPIGPSDFNAPVRLQFGNL